MIFLSQNNICMNCAEQALFNDGPDPGLQGFGSELFPDSLEPAGRILSGPHDGAVTVR
ncbi:MAG: hypothetical protein UEP81_10105 [Sutterella wadsworthensis]|jgi:hypothetical protein|nr:hypothetical protein [Sutterella wadsworthensis]MEE0162568.1 hypothetical protein [Sutterella wadsworthensis]